MILQGGASIGELLSTTGPLARIILLILLLFSLKSWGTIISKMLRIRRIRKESTAFWEVFQNGKNLAAVSSACKALNHTPLVPVFEAGIRMISDRGAKPEESEVGMHGSAIEQELVITSDDELRDLETGMTFLATTASVTPFIGLFGTVWGVIGSFAGLANESVTTLRAVGPGIAEALIATAFGLFAAIPAVVAYNFFVAEIRYISDELNDLRLKFMASTNTTSYRHET